jgi:hypothetical protein
MDKKIKYLSYNKIIFNDMNGELINNFEFLQKICKIDTTKYDYIYHINNRWTGAYLLVKNNNYRFIECGSGKPIINDTIGKLIVE